MIPFDNRNFKASDNDGGLRHVSLSNSLNFILLFFKRLRILISDGLKGTNIKPQFGHLTSLLT